MGAGSQSRFNRLLPDLGFRDRSRHKGVHCVRTGYSLETPARIAPITALVQAMQASVYAWSSICCILGWGGEFGPDQAPVGRAQVATGHGAIGRPLNCCATLDRDRPVFVRPIRNKRGRHLKRAA